MRLKRFIIPARFTNNTTSLKGQCHEIFFSEIFELEKGFCHEMNIFGRTLKLNQYFCDFDDGFKYFEETLL